MDERISGKFMKHARYSKKKGSSKRYSSERICVCGCSRDSSKTYCCDSVLTGSLLNTCSPRPQINPFRKIYRPSRERDILPCEGPHSLFGHVSGHTLCEMRRTILLWIRKTLRTASQNNSPPALESRLPRRAIANPCPHRHHQQQGKCPTLIYRSCTRRT